MARVECEKMICKRWKDRVREGKRWVDVHDNIEVAVLAIVGKYAMVRFAKGAMPRVVSTRDLSIAPPPGSRGFADLSLTQ